MFINQPHTVVENLCRDVNITVFLDIVYDLQFFLQSRFTGNWI